MTDVSVVITTKNRKEDLRAALASVVRQSIPVETIVFDDGSEDDTTHMVRNDFPNVRLVRDGNSRGLIVRRNQLARLASGEVIVSLDDDAAFSTPYVIEQTLCDFDDARIGAVAIPFVNVRQDSVLRQKASSDSQIDVLASFIGTAHAVRREVFLSLGGYRDHFVHQGEEGDFCIRLLDAGWIVRAGRADPIHHYESPRRSFRRMDYYGRRNDLLFAWHNCPLRYLPGRLAAATVGGVVFGCHVRRPIRMVVGLMAGYVDGVRFRGHRRPVSSDAYQLFRTLSQYGPMPIRDIEMQLSALSTPRKPWSTIEPTSMAPPAGFPCSSEC